MNDTESIISSTINKKIMPVSYRLKQGDSLWIGAVARIDFMSGEDKNFTFFFSHNITLHKTSLLSCEETFEKHAGKRLRPIINTNYLELQLRTHVFNLECDKQTLSNYDIIISGLGWFSISGKGFVQLHLNAPEQVKIFLRNKPIMPYELQKLGIKKFTGKTHNSNSKTNKKYNTIKEVTSNNINI